MGVAPVQPSQNITPAKKSYGRIFWTVLIVILLAVAYSASAYFLNLWPFSANPRVLFTESFNNLLKIDSVSSSINIKLNAQDKEKDAEKLSTELLQYTSEKQPMYDRDNDRIRDIGIVKSKLQQFFYQNKNYPITLDLAGITISKDPSGKIYTYETKDSQKDFNFVVDFETIEAVDLIKKSSYSDTPDISGNKVTFHKNSLESFYSYGTLKPKLPGFVNIISSLNSSIVYLPSDTNINIDISGTAQSKKQNIPDTRLSANVDAKFSDMSYKAGAEVLKKDADIYFKLNSFPSLFLFGGMDKIKQKWIQITPDDLSAYGIQDFAKADTELKQQVLEQIKSIFTLALSDDAISGYDKAEVVKINGKNYYKYTIALNKNKIVKFYKDLTDEFNNQFGDKSIIKFDQTTYDYMQSPAFDKLYDYISKNIKFYYYVDPIGHYPFRFEYNVRLVPDYEASGMSGLFGSARASDKQFILNLSVSLTDINKAIKIDAPKDFMTFMDAQISMTGQTKEQYLMAKQTANISSMQRALNNYYYIAGVYPKSLDDLMKTSSQITVVKAPFLATNASSDSEYYKKQFAKNPLLKAVPKDAYTLNAYTYSAQTDPDDYKLSFTIKLPPYEKGTMPSYSIYKNNSVYNSVTNKYDYSIDLAYNDGINNVTASSYMGSYGDDSKQKVVVDSDKDGLSDNFEAYLGTNQQKKDTDGDGISDGEEFQLGSNPLGTGSLTRSYY